MSRQWMLSGFPLAFSCCLVSKSCLTLCDPMDCTLQALLSMGILQARILEWVCHFLLKGIFPTQGSTHVSCLSGGFFTTEPPGKPKGYSFPCSQSPHSLVSCPHIQFSAMTSTCQIQQPFLIFSFFDQLAISHKIQ